MKVDVFHRNIVFHFKDDEEQQKIMDTLGLEENGNWVRLVLLTGGDDTEFFLSTMRVGGKNAFGGCKHCDWGKRDG